MTDKGSPAATRTVAHSSLEDLITPRLEPGKACLIVIRGRSVGLLLELQKLPAVVGRSPDVELTIDDLAVSRRHAQVERGPDGFLVRDLGSTNGVFVNGVRVQAQALRDGDRIQIGTAAILKFCFQDELEADLQKKLYDSATRDSLTGLYNRRFFIETLEVDFTQAVRNDQVISLLLIDLDHFKAVNDTYGHPVGDLVLAQSARLIQSALRAEDLAGRLGGEEFVVLLRYTDGRLAFSIAERIRQTMASHDFEFQGGTLRLTASIGLATLDPAKHASAAKLIEAADRFLYRAKRQGRNRTLYDDREATGRLMAKTLVLPPEESAEAPAKGGPQDAPPVLPDPGELGSAETVPIPVIKLGPPEEPPRRGGPGARARPRKPGRKR
jgi:diguanylate cyclase (GGDEF)-like protein